MIKIAITLIGFEISGYTQVKRERERERERCYFPNTTLLEEDRESFFPVPLR